MDELENCESDILKCLGNETRYQILNELKKEDKYVNELVKELEKEQTLISHHLKKLRDCGLIYKKRKGRKMIYSIKDDEIIELIEKLNKIDTKINKDN